MNMKLNNIGVGINLEVETDQKAFEEGVKTQLAKTMFGPEMAKKLLDEMTMAAQRRGEKSIVQQLMRLALKQIIQDEVDAYVLANKEAITATVQAALAKCLTPENVAALVYTQLSDVKLRVPLQFTPQGALLIADAGVEGTKSFKKDPRTDDEDDED